MPYDVSEIKAIRKQFGLTQSELAKKSGVSQSLIAKIEAGKVDPSYSKVRQIFNFLENLHKERELKAGDVMHSSIISIAPDSDIKSAIANARMGIITVKMQPIPRQTGWIFQGCSLCAVRLLYTPMFHLSL